MPNINEKRVNAFLEHTYNPQHDELEAERTVKLYAHARHDGLAQLELSSIRMCEHYEDREDL